MLYVGVYVTPSLAISMINVWIGIDTGQCVSYVNLLIIHSIHIDFCWENYSTNYF